MAFLQLLLMVFMLLVLVEEPLDHSFILCLLVPILEHFRQLFVFLLNQLFFDASNVLIDELLQIGDRAGFTHHEAVSRYEIFKLYRLAGASKRSQAGPARLRKHLGLPSLHLTHLSLTPDL